VISEAAQKSLGEPPGCTEVPLRIQKLHLTQFFGKHRESWLGICNIYPQFLSLIFTDTVSSSALQGWAPLPEQQVQGCHVLMDRMKSYFHVLLLYRKLLGLMSNRMQFPQLMGLCWEKQAVIYNI
jgi:hypothetical protein